MTKAQIVDRIADATGLTKIETEAVVDGFMQTVLDAVAGGVRLGLPLPGRWPRLPDLLRDAAKR